jgi:hypothetical protein
MPSGTTYSKKSWHYRLMRAVWDSNYDTSDVFRIGKIDYAVRVILTVIIIPSMYVWYPTAIQIYPDAQVKHTRTDNMMMAGVMYGTFGWMLAFILATLFTTSISYFYTANFIAATVSLWVIMPFVTALLVKLGYIIDGFNKPIEFN